MAHYSGGMSIRALVITTSDERAFLRVIEDDLEDLTAIVGGFIEAINVTEDAIMYLNEEGKLHGLPFNYSANALIRAAPFRLHGGDFLVGNVVVVGTRNGLGQHDAENHDVPKSVLTLCRSAGIEVVESAP